MENISDNLASSINWIIGAKLIALYILAVIVAVSRKKNPFEE